MRKVLLMRIDYLSLLAFGRFTDEKITFPADRGLHLIYGPNEAGKSTMLRAIVDALFGIPRNSQDGFLHDYGNMRIEAGLTFSDGTSVAFRRRKGQKNTLLDLEDQPLDEKLLAAYTAGLERSDFENMFGLDHLRLRAGGKQLLESGGSLGESLFEAASGLNDLRRIMDALDKQAGDLFKPSGKIPPVNQLASQYKAEQRELEGALLSARTFKALEAQYQSELLELENLENKLRDGEGQKVRLSRIKRTRPLLTEVQSLNEELSSLGPLPKLSLDSADYAELKGKLQQAEAGKADANWQIDKLRQEIQELEIPQGILEHQTTIDELQEGLALYRQAVKNLPSLKNSLELTRQSALLKLKELRPDAENLSVVEEYRLPLHLFESVDELAERFNLLQTQLDKAQELLENKRADVENSRVVLAQFGTLADTTQLHKLVNKVRAEGDLQKLRQDKQLEVDALEQAVNSELVRLPLWQASLKELAEASFPLASTVAQFADEQRELSEEERALAKQIADLENRKLSLEQELVKLTMHGKVPSETELVMMRAKRDHGWELILKSWIYGQPDLQGEAVFAKDQPLHEAYADTVQGADQIADQLRSESERVARQATYTGELNAVIQELEQRKVEIQHLQKRQGDFTQRWLKVWSCFPFEPLSPVEMQEWLVTCQTLVEKHRELLQKKKQLQELEQLSESYAQALRAELERLGMTPHGRLVDLLEQASDFCEKVSELRGEQRSLAQRLREQEMELERAKRRLKLGEEEIERWRDEWSGLMKQIKLPTTTTVPVAEKYLDELRDLLHLMDSLATAQTTKEQQEALITGYEGKVAEVAAQVGILGEGQEVFQVVMNLVQTSRQATRDLATKLEKTKQVEALEEKVHRFERLITQSKARVTQLIAEAGCQSQAELEALLQKQEQVQVLKEKIQEGERQLRQLGDGLTLEELAAEAEGVDMDTIDYELQKLENELAELRQEQNALNQSFGVTRKEYEEKIQGRSAKANLAAEQAQATLASLSEAVDEYFTAKLGSLVLRRAIERYRDEHQDPVLKRAGEIFNLLTGGSFTQLTVDYDANENPIIKGLREGEKVGVEGMSDGTQDQLYLALRLASIEQYLTQGEPMPLIVDDVLINFDDLRSASALKALADLSQYTQVIMFTHHVSIVRMAKKVLPERSYAIHVLGGAEVEEPLQLEMALA